MFGSKKQKPEGPDAQYPFLAAYMMPDGGMEVRLNPSQIPSAEFAGLILADIMRHFARALAMTGTSPSEDEATRKMLDMFVAEISAPTDLGSGSLVN